MGVGKTTGQVKGWRFYIIAAHVLDDEILDGRDHLVRPEAAKDDPPRQPFQGIPGSRVGALVRCG